MRRGTVESRIRPKVHPAARVKATIIGLDITCYVLRHHSYAADWAAIQARDIDIEETARPRLVRGDLLDHAPGILGRQREIERLGLGVFERDGNARPLKESPFNSRCHRA